jgi:hypothetical protein
MHAKRISLADSAWTSHCVGDAYLDAQEYIAFVVTFPRDLFIRALAEPRTTNVKLDIGGDLSISIVAAPRKLVDKL